MNLQNKTKNMRVWGHFNFYEKRSKNKNKITSNSFNFVVGKTCEYVYALMPKIDTMTFKKTCRGHIHEIKPRF